SFLGTRYRPLGTDLPAKWLNVWRGWGGNRVEFAGPSGATARHYGAGRGLLKLARFGFRHFNLRAAEIGLERLQIAGCAAVSGLITYQQPDIGLLLIDVDSLALLQQNA